MNDTQLLSLVSAIIFSQVRELHPRVGQSREQWMNEILDNSVHLAKAIIRAASQVS